MRLPARTVIKTALLAFCFSLWADQPQGSDGHDWNY
jgi:hypothetical protein